jgi:hypothetical protein
MADDKDMHGLPPGGLKHMRIGKLRTLGDVSDELTRLYKRFFHGQITSADASRMASVLQVKRQCLADTAVEQRLDNIEAKLTADTDNVKPFRNVA